MSLAIHFSVSQMITVRAAQLSDVVNMMPLLNEYARQAEILPRNEDEVYRSIREWAVAELDGQLIGMGALLIMWRDLAEVRSLVIDPIAHGQGAGKKIIHYLINEAQLMNIPRIFALTRKPGFFLKLGFQITRIENLPRKVKRDCVFCPKFHACDEVAVIMPLTENALAIEPEELDLPGVPHMIHYINGNGNGLAISLMGK